MRIINLPRVPMFDDKSEPRPKWQEYEPMRETREVLYTLRLKAQLTREQVAQDLSDETGYLFTGDQYRAIEQGLTKNIPAWVVIAFMMRYNVLPEDLFPSVGREY